MALAVYLEDCPPFYTIGKIERLHLQYIVARESSGIAKRTNIENGPRRRPRNEMPKDQRFSWPIMIGSSNMEFDNDSTTSI